MINKKIPIRIALIVAFNLPVLAYAQTENEDNGCNFWRTLGALATGQPCGILQDPAQTATVPQIIAETRENKIEAKDDLTATLEKFVHVERGKIRATQAFQQETLVISTLEQRLAVAQQHGNQPSIRTIKAMINELGKIRIKHQYEMVDYEGQFSRVKEQVQDRCSVFLQWSKALAALEKSGPVKTKCPDSKKLEELHRTLPMKRYISVQGVNANGESVIVGKENWEQ